MMVETPNPPSGEKGDYFLAELEEGELVMKPYCRCGNPWPKNITVKSVGASAVVRMWSAWMKGPSVSFRIILLLKT